MSQIEQRASTYAGRPPLPDTITLTGEQADTIATMLIGINEFLTVLDGLTPPIVGKSIEEQGSNLRALLFGDDFPEDDRGYETHPVIVDEWAVRAEYAAQLFDNALCSGGSGYKIFGMPRDEARAHAGRLRAVAAATRLSGDILYDRETTLRAVSNEPNPAA